MEKSWLQTKRTREELEAENMVERKNLWPQPVPFGFMYPEWKQLLAQQQPGDELWTFSSSNESWEEMAGRKGIALVRQGEVVDHIVTEMN